MSCHGKKLIKKIKDVVNCNNLELIYNEFKFIEESNKIKDSIDIMCSLINIIGNYLITAQKQDSPEHFAIYDTFCSLDFMSQFLKLSSYDYYKINLQLIKTLSFLLINVKNKPTLYYLFSNNLLNKIISKDYSKYDDEFLSYYVNFLKSLSLIMDETSIQLFYIEKNNSFPLVENILKLYNHKDSMIRNVVRNTVMTILRVKNTKIEEHFSKLPTILYFVKIILHLRDICFEIKEYIKNKNNKKISYLFDDLLDELIYIDDLLNLNMEKISYIIMNSFFNFFIIPVLCCSITNENKKLPKELSLFLLIFLFINMKNENFKNCLFAVLFLDEISPEIENLLKLELDINDFFINNININQEKNNINTINEIKNNDNISFYQFFSEHYSYYFLLTIIENNNIIYTKYGKMYPQLKKIMERGKELSQEIIYGQNSKKFSFEEIVKNIQSLINKYFNEHELDNMKDYHEYLSKGTGLVIGDLNKENIKNKKSIDIEELIYDKCFMYYIRDVFNRNKNIIFKKNKIKENLFEILNYKKEETLLLFNILLFVVLNKETNISKNLLKRINLINMFDSINPNINNLGQNINNISNTSISLNKNIFIFDNNFFTSLNDINDYPNVKNNNILLEQLSNLLILDTPFWPITYLIIYQNIINLSLDSNYICYTDCTDKFFKNIESKYKSILFFINSLFSNKSKNSDNCFDIFYNQWSFYKNLNNKLLLNIIKNNVISSMDILTITNTSTISDLVDSFEIYTYTNLNNTHNDKDIFLKSKKENVSFDTNLLIFMLIYDLKHIFKNNKMNITNNIIDTLIKTKFPLNYYLNNINIGQKYDIDSINDNKLYKKNVYYKIINISNKKEKKVFIICQIFFYEKYLFFGEKEEFSNIKGNIQIFKKIDLKLIFSYKDYNNKKHGDNCVEIKVNGVNNELIIIKFENNNQRKEFKNLISQKVGSISNNERKLFGDYFGKLVEEYKDEKLKKDNNI